MPYESNECLYLDRNELIQLFGYNHFDRWNLVEGKYLEVCQDEKKRANVTKLYNDLRENRSPENDGLFLSLNEYFKTHKPKSVKPKEPLRIRSVKAEEELYTDKNVVVYKEKRTPEKKIKEDTKGLVKKKILFTEDMFRSLTESTEDQMSFLKTTSRDVEGQIYYDPIEAMRQMNKGDEELFPEEYKEKARIALANAILEERKKDLF